MLKAGQLGVPPTELVPDFLAQLAGAQVPVGWRIASVRDVRHHIGASRRAIDVCGRWATVGLNGGWIGGSGYNYRIVANSIVPSHVLLVSFPYDPSRRGKPSVEQRFDLTSMPSQQVPSSKDRFRPTTPRKSLSAGSLSNPGLLERPPTSMLVHTQELRSSSRLDSDIQGSAWSLPPSRSQSPSGLTPRNRAASRQGPGALPSLFMDRLDELEQVQRRYTLDHISLINALRDELGKPRDKLAGGDSTTKDLMYSSIMTPNGYLEASSIRFLPMRVNGVQVMFPQAVPETYLVDLSRLGDINDVIAYRFSEDIRDSDELHCVHHLDHVTGNEAGDWVKVEMNEVIAVAAKAHERLEDASPQVTLDHGQSEHGRHDRHDHANHDRDIHAGGTGSVIDGAAVAATMSISPVFDTTRSALDSPGLSERARPAPVFGRSMTSQYSTSGSRSFCGIASEVDSELSVHSGPLEKAFVINLSRLTEMAENLHLLHELIVSTAIASLTLVVAGSVQQIINTVTFLIAIVVLFAEHMHRHDRLDISDLRNAVQIVPAQPQNNCNQFLAAMTVIVWRRLLRNALMRVVILAYIVLGWLCVARRFAITDADITGSVLTEAVGHFDEILFGNTTDVLAGMTMQLTVLTVMYVLVITHWIIFNYETTAVMPATADGKIWDVRKYGTPLKFWLLGLPSMWFTNQPAKDKLRQWVNALTPNQRVRALFPEEIAFFALGVGPEDRAALANTLRNARYFDAATGQCEGEILDLELCFFVSKLQGPHAHFQGDYVDVQFASAPSLRRGKSHAYSPGRSRHMEEEDELGRAGDMHHYVPDLDGSFDDRQLQPASGSIARCQWEAGI